MGRELIIYSVFVLLFAVLMGLIIAAPLLSFSQEEGWLYKAFAPTCHQKISRSLCIFSDVKSYWMGDCTPQGSGYVPDASDRSTIKVVAPGPNGTITGFKMPVCSRDFGIYGAMLLGALIYPLLRDLKGREVWPAIWLILAMVPLALDGGIQLVSELGLLPFVYESTNAMRLFTGALSGFVAALYAIPILMNMFSGDEKPKAGVLDKADEGKQAGKE
jgi:uncharacterized membrane protein